MLSFYNSLTRSKQRFVPIEPGKVKLYVCGMTVYDLSHLGHARVLLVFDMLQRWLRASGYEVYYVRNVTDIDDKIIQRAQQQGVSVSELTDHFIECLEQDCTALGVEAPTESPRATQYIDSMQRMIGTLMQREMAYQADNQDVYFAVESFKSYGALSAKNLSQLQAGVRVQANHAKRNPLDFVLWKHAKPGEPAWDSPWGKGRPGWHIECSAMSTEILGPHFDIHGGGEDLQFPHHENEIAQSEGSHQCSFVNYWLHNGFVNIQDEKMSKSSGNFLTIRTLLKDYHPEVIRFFVLKAHYRSPLNYHPDRLEEARSGLRSLYTALSCCADLSTCTAAINWQHPSAAQFQSAMDDDLNTPQALAVLFELAHEVNKTQDAVLGSLLHQLGSCLGLLNQVPAEFLQHTQGALDTDQIDRLVAARSAAKKSRDYARADEIRVQLDALGVIVEDGKDGSRWRSR